MQGTSKRSPSPAVVLDEDDDEYSDSPGGGPVSGPGGGSGSLNVSVTVSDVDWLISVCCSPTQKLIVGGSTRDHAPTLQEAQEATSTAPSGS